MSNVLVVTSCNRIKQTLLALSLNAQTIRERFCVVVCDNSTPYVTPEVAVEHHRCTDPYNRVTVTNYCNDISLFSRAHQYFDNVDEFKVIHNSPLLPKQQGEATLMA